MKAVILAGGLGTRLSEETHLKPKPMLEIGGMPILWHIMKIYSSHGINEFLVCCGYKGYLIKEYFCNYSRHVSDITVDFQNDSLEVHSKRTEPWKVTLIDTGDKTMTGGRLLRIREYLDESPFCFTYGDGVSDIDISSLISFHLDKGLAATITAVQPPGRYGALDLSADGIVHGFQEKPLGDRGWINGGYFVLNTSVFDLIKGDTDVWEEGPLKTLASTSQLGFQAHRLLASNGYLRDKNYLNNLWACGSAPWKLW